MTRLVRVEIHALRGIRDLTLPFDGGSVVLGGGSGTGKSACVDAIEFLYTGSISTLVGTQGLGLREHGPHIHARLEEASVTATYAEPDGKITRHLSGQLDVPVALEDHLADGTRLAFILRRSQLQQFIHAKPADRYRSMADLIGVERLDRTELALKHARDTLESELRQGETRLSQVANQLAERPVELADDVLLREANIQLEALGITEIALEHVEDAAAARASILGDMSGLRPDPAVEARMHFAAELRRGIGQDHLRSAIEAYTSITAEGRTAGGSRMVELLQLLRRSRDYLRESQSESCPICERDIAGRVLTVRLVERVAELEEVSLHEERLQQSRDDLSSASQDTGSRVAALDRLLPESGMQVTSGPLMDAVTMLQRSARSGTLVETRDMAGRMQDALLRWEEWVNFYLAHMKSESEGLDDANTSALHAALSVLEGLTAQRAAAERGRQERERLSQERNSLRGVIVRAQSAFQMADTTYRTFNRVKNEEIQRVFDDLRADLARLYDFLHPGEGHGAVAIAMDPRKRGSSELRMGFYGSEGEDPRAFASEGHLDSLGLCIFLAFVKRFHGDWPLLVLDDVVTSIDAAHKQRVARLLYQEFGDRQLLLTTNDARWFIDLQRAQQETGHTQSRNLVIESWSLDTGPRIREEVLSPPRGKSDGFAGSR